MQLFPWVSDFAKTYKVHLKKPVVSCVCHQQPPFLYHDGNRDCCTKFLHNMRRFSPFDAAAVCPTIVNEKPLSSLTAQVIN